MPGTTNEAIAATGAAIINLLFIPFLLARRGSRPRRSRWDCSIPSYGQGSKGSLDGWSKFGRGGFSPMSAPCLGG
jgi:hypothetical protein